MIPFAPNDPLSRALGAWRVRPTANPEFRPAVWERIRRRSHDTWSGYLRAHLVSWSVATAALVAAAGWAGRSAAEARLEARRDAMVISYLGELDPRVLAKLRPE